MHIFVQIYKIGSDLLHAIYNINICIYIYMSDRSNSFHVYMVRFGGFSIEAFDLC